MTVKIATDRDLCKTSAWHHKAHGEKRNLRQYNATQQEGRLTCRTSPAQRQPEFISPASGAASNRENSSHGTRPTSAPPQSAQS